jgi:hypothetical protein
MYPRTEYEMTQEDLDAILNASKATPVMFVSGGGSMFGSPQENANAAWASLGARMGFDYMTVRSVSGKGQRFFTAVPNETEEARKEREVREAAEARKREVVRITGEIEKLQARLAELNGL